MPLGGGEVAQQELHFAQVAEGGGRPVAFAQAFAQLQPPPVQGIGAVFTRIGDAVRRWFGFGDPR